MIGPRLNSLKEKKRKGTVEKKGRRETEGWKNGRGRFDFANCIKINEILVKLLGN